MSQTVLLSEQIPARTSSRVGGASNHPPARVRVRPVALPTEHGGWGLTLEPAALGLLVAPTAAGALLALAALCAFLARHPLKIVAGDRRRARRFPRTALAEKFALLYSAASAASFAAAVFLAHDRRFLYAFAAAVPLAAVQLFFDLAGRSRRLLPELAGSVAMASLAACIALAAGWPAAQALALWAALSSRFLPSILYVRAALTRLHGKRVAALPPLAAHVAALACVVALAADRLLPPIAALPFAIMLLRAARGLLNPPANATARRVGFSEIGYGVLTVLLVAAAYRLGS